MPVLVLGTGLVDGNQILDNPETFTSGETADISTQLQGLINNITADVPETADISTQLAPLTNTIIGGVFPSHDRCYGTWF